MFCLGLSANPLQVRGLKGVISEVIKRPEHYGLATLAGTNINCCTYKLNSSVKKS